MSQKVVSRHYFRRRARKKAEQFRRPDRYGPFKYRVEKAVRGPWRWLVVRYREEP